MTSTRLPGKVLLVAGGLSMLAHQLVRLKSVGVPIVVATTVNSSDDPIVQEATAFGAGIYRGDEEDVLARFDGAAEAAKLDVIVRVTSDCPLIDPRLIERGIDKYLALDNEYAHVSNVLDRSYPRGFDFEVFSGLALSEAARYATEPADREHVTPYLYANRSGRATMHPIRREVDASSYRVTLDTADDFELIRQLIEIHDAAALDAEGIISVLDAHPELAGINAHIDQKELGD